MPPSLKRILVTGFGPFKGYTQNPSSLAVQRLNDTVISVNGERLAQIISIEIPVIYQDVLDIIPGLHATPPVYPSNGGASGSSEGFSLIVHVGVGKEGPLNVETIARKTGYASLDVDKKLPDFVGDAGGGKRGFGGDRYGDMDEELRIPLDVSQIVDKVSKKGVQIIPSKDAGNYLCEFIFYCSLAESKLAGNGTPAMFIHCSPIGKPMDTDEVADGIRIIIAEACTQLNWG